jgi:hypothetical protein
MFDKKAIPRNLSRHLYYANLPQTPAQTILEVGLDTGLSLDGWKQFFGPAATIFGIDITFENLKIDPLRYNIFEISSTDKIALANAFHLHQFDTIIDDGSVSKKYLTFCCLEPYLKPGGKYIIETLLHQTHAIHLYQQIQQHYAHLKSSMVVDVNEQLIVIEKPGASGERL